MAMKGRALPLKACRAFEMAPGKAAVEPDSMLVRRRAVWYFSAGRPVGPLGRLGPWTAPIASVKPTTPCLDAALASIEQAPTCWAWRASAPGNSASMHVTT
jgi:hypothetical protein